MKKLVINTATDELFIVLKIGNAIFSKSINSKMHHNETMLPIIDEMLKEHNVEIAEIEEFGVVIGPGSFTGIRVGIATIKAFRDSLKVKAKGINNLNYLFALAQNYNQEISTVAIAGSKDSYFTAKQIHNVLYKYERNLSLNELTDVSENKPVGMFKKDDFVKCIVLEQNAEVLLKCLEDSEDYSLVPVYYQLSQAENEKLKRSEIAIEIANAEDVKNIAEIEKNSIIVNTMSEKTIENALQDKNYTILKAVLDNEIVGFIMLQKSDELNIDSIAVKKEYRNLGIATKLVNSACEVAKENKIQTLSLEVAYNNITAYLLYKKLGFIKRRIRKNYYADGSDCIEMVKEIK